MKEHMHTKGPWVTYEPVGNKLSGPSVWSKGGMLLCQMAGLGSFDYENARLIALAPEMFQALRDIATDYDHEGDRKCYPSCRVCIAEKVLAKIGGLT